MSVLVRSLVAAAVLALLTLAACSPGGSLAGRTPPQPLQVGALTLPEVDSAGSTRTFAFRASPGELLYVFFGYANCPDICPTTLAELRRALATLGPLAGRVEVAFVTVDPVRDSAAVLAPYLASFVPGGHALRPENQSQLGRAQAAFNATSAITRGRDGAVQVAHTSWGYLVDERGTVRLQWDYGTPAKDMAHDLRVLLGRIPAAPR